MVSNIPSFNLCDRLTYYLKGESDVCKDKHPIPITRRNYQNQNPEGKYLFHAGYQVPFFP